MQMVSSPDLIRNLLLPLLTMINLQQEHLQAEAPNAMDQNGHPFPFKIWSREICGSWNSWFLGQQALPISNLVASNKPTFLDFWVGNAWSSYRIRTCKLESRTLDTIPIIINAQDPTSAQNCIFEKFEFLISPGRMYDFLNLFSGWPEDSTAVSQSHGIFEK